MLHSIVFAASLFGLYIFGSMFKGNSQPLPERKNYAIINVFTQKIFANGFSSPEDAIDWMENYFEDHKSYLSVKNDFEIKETSNIIASIPLKQKSKFKNRISEYSLDELDFHKWN